MPVLSRLQDFLDRTHTSYGHTVHSPAYTARQLARAEHVPENEIAKTIVFVGDNGYGMIIDTSSNNQWPNGPVLWHGAALDITKPVVDAYNAQSGVAPPAPKQGGTSGARPSGGISKPTAPATTKPASTQPPAK